MSSQELDNFCKNLQSLCDDYGSVQALADRVGVSRVYMSVLLHGHKEPRLGYAIQIARAVGVPLDDLFLPTSKFKKLHGKKASS